jgi:hypothetical protein
MAKASGKNKMEKTPVGVTFTGVNWVTPDGRKFNSRLKAERHSLTIEPSPDTGSASENQEGN